MTNHKDRMKWLKENDPITYSEMTSNPTGVDSEPGFWIGPLLVVISIVSIIVIAFLMS